MRRAREEEDEPEPEPAESPSVRDSLIEFGKANLPSWAKKPKIGRPIPIAVADAEEEDETQKVITPEEILRQERRERRRAAQENRARIRGDPPPPPPEATGMSVQDRYALYKQQKTEATASKMRAEGESPAPPPLEALDDDTEELDMLGTALELPSFEGQDAEDGFDANDEVFSYCIGNREVTFPVSADDETLRRMFRESLEAEIGPEKLAKVLQELRACEACDDTPVPTLGSLPDGLIMMAWRLLALTRDEK
jgi:hypothetical protein